MKVELEKDILKSLGIYDTTISFGLDDDIQIAIEKKIDNYLKKIDVPSAPNTICGCSLIRSSMVRTTRTRMSAWLRTKRMESS